MAPGRCPRCSAEIDTLDRYCRICGANQRAAAWYHTKAVVLLSAFLVIGPFALPLLWTSPAFGRVGKVIWTVLIIAYTIGAFVACILGVKLWYAFLMSQLAGRY
jgi:hypothetical protein